MVLFTIANTTTTSFGLYYFQYILGEKDLYSVFAGVLGVSQLLALILFPFLSQKIGRSKLYALGTILVCIGYLFFYVAGNIVTVSIGGVLTFFGEGFIQILMLIIIIVAGYILYKKKFKIDKEFYEKIIKDLEIRRTADK